MRCTSLVAAAGLLLAVCALSSSTAAAAPAPAAGESQLQSLLRLIVSDSGTPMIPSWHASASKIGISGPNLTLAEQSAFIADRYKSSSKVTEIRDRVPRFGGTKDFDPAHSDYQRTLANEVGPGAAGFVVTLIIWIVYCFVQCCCAKPNPAGYTRAQRLVPLVVGSLCGLVVIAFCIVGLVSTQNFDNEMVGSTGLTVSAKNVVTHVNSFFTSLDSKLLDTKGQVSAVAGPGGAIQTIIANFTNPRPLLPPFLDVLTAFGRNVGAHNPVTVYQYDHLADPTSTDPITYSSTYLSDTPGKVNNIAQSISDNANPVFDTIDKTKTTASNEVVNAESQIQAQITDARTQLDSLHTQTTSYDNNVDDYQDKVKKYEDIRRQVVLALFLLPIALVLLWFIFAVGCRKERGTKCVVCGLFPVGMLLWILFLIHLPFAVMVADSCNYLDGVDPYLYRQTIFDAKVANTLTACLAKQNLLVPLGVADQLDFGSSIVFPAVTADGLLNTTVLSDINNQVQSLDRATFSAYDPTAKVTALNQLNSRTYPDYFTFANITAACDPNNPAYTPNNLEVRRLKNSIVTALRVEIAMDSLISEVKVNMTVVMTSFGGLQRSTQDLLDNLNRLQGTITPLLQSAQSVIDSSFCAPLDDDYLQLKSVFCSRMIVSIGNIAMASFFAAIFLGLVNFSGWSDACQSLPHSLVRPFSASLTGCGCVCAVVAAVFVRFLIHRLQHGVEQVASWGAVAGAAGGATGVEMGAVAEGGQISPAYASGQVASPSGMVMSPSGMAADPYAPNYNLPPPGYAPQQGQMSGQGQPQPMQFNQVHGGSNPDQVALQFAAVGVEASAPPQSADPRYRGASTI